MPLSKEIEKFKRKALEEILEKLTESQRNTFQKLFPKEVPENKLCEVYDLCERTLIENKKVCLEVFNDKN
ncbi:MAG: hypothetical protein EKK64_09875 [Neisseriaceae bacterium]|nr:MAG: hypothetical protein EKK64_09875 [Neisseriaceae bacterium]